MLAQTELDAIRKRSEGYNNWVNIEAAALVREGNLMAGMILAPVAAAPDDITALLAMVGELRAALQVVWKLSIMELSVSSRLEVATAGEKIQAIIAPVLYPEAAGGEANDGN